MLWIHSLLFEFVVSCLNCAVLGSKGKFNTAHLEVQVYNMEIKVHFSFDLTHAKYNKYGYSTTNSQCHTHLDILVYHSHVQTRLITLGL